jgi:spermidine synthase
VRIVRTRRGARIIDDDVVLSEIRRDPGPTHSLFDVLAACVAALAPGPKCALLGFAGGGMVAPLRAMGYEGAVEAVDLSREGEEIFRELSDDWAGTVTLAEADAAEWLRARRARYDVIVEDLSVPSPVGTVKPYVSLDTLPELIRARLKPEGVAMFNLLPLPGTSWDALLMRVARPHASAVCVHLDEYENRFVLAGDALPTAADASRHVRGILREIGSYMADRVFLRTLFRG